MIDLLHTGHGAKLTFTLEATFHFKVVATGCKKIMTYPKSMEISLVPATKKGEHF